MPDSAESAPPSDTIAFAVRESAPVALQLSCARSASSTSDPVQMNEPVRHYKRLRMQIDLQRLRKLPMLLEGYRFIPWVQVLQQRHARVQWHAFRGDLDGGLFGCLSSLAGCSRLIRETVHHPLFCVRSTWLVVFQPEQDWPAVDCATIQGLMRPGSTGSIQNVGVVPEHRGFGLGRAIMLKALHGFQIGGARRVTLEVTAVNHPAVALYRSLGFHVTRVLYRTASAGSVVNGSERAPYPTERMLYTSGH